MNTRQYSGELKRRILWLVQGSATYGPRAGSGPPIKIIRPAAPLQIAVISSPA